MSKTNDKLIKPLRDQRSSVFEEDKAMVSVDVTAVFTSIDLDLAKKISKNPARTLYGQTTLNTNILWTTVNVPIHGIQI